MYYTRNTIDRLGPARIAIWLQLGNAKKNFNQTLHLDNYFSTAHESPLKTKKPAQAHLRGIQQHDYRLDSGISPPTECSCAASAVNFPEQIKQESQEGTYSQITFSYLKGFAHLVFFLQGASHFQHSQSRPAFHLVPFCETKL